MALAVIQRTGDDPGRIVGQPVQRIAQDAALSPTGPCNAVSK
jgi:hypothetical protein